MSTIAEALADPLARSLYLGLCLALILVPITALWQWYRRRVKKNAVDKAMLVRVSVITLLWMIVNATAFGILIWADEVNRIPG